MFLCIAIANFLLQLCIPCSSFWIYHVYTLSLCIICCRWSVHSIFVFVLSFVVTMNMYHEVCRAGQYIIYHVFMTVKKKLSVCGCFWRRRVWCAISSMKQWNAAYAFVHSCGFTFDTFLFVALANCDLIACIWWSYPVSLSCFIRSKQQALQFQVQFDS